MRTSRWVLSILAVAVVGLAVVTWRASGGAGAGSFVIGGELPPLLPDALGEWREVGRIPADLLRSDGPVVALEAVDGELFALRYNHWYRLGRSGLMGPFGDATRGSPNWIERAVDLAWHDGRVYLLDGGRRQVSVWTDTGTRLHEIPLELNGTVPFEPEQIEVDALGRLYIVAHVASIYAPGDWMVLRVSDDGSSPDTLWRAPSGATAGAGANMPHISIRGDGNLLVATALDYELHRIAEHGELLDIAVRRDPPAFEVPDSIRRQHEELLARLPFSMREAYAMPDRIPPVRGVTLRADGSVVARVARTFETSYIEWLAPDGSPLGTISGEAIAEPIHVSEESIFRAREAIDVIVIETARLTLPD
ncbi:MAG TPA: hypothetical protein VNZ57_10785 [Longimicrobiales bacterium]|nr:hypothetical protein [Longimicrobiales bacterium]